MLGEIFQKTQTKVYLFLSFQFFSLVSLYFVISTVFLSVFVFHKHIVFAEVGSGVPACYAQSVFTNTFGPRGGTCVVFSCKDYVCNDYNNFDDEIKIFLGVFASAFGPRRPKGGSSHLWLKRFSLSLQKQIQHLQLMSGGSHMKAFGKFKTGKKQI